MRCNGTTDQKTCSLRGGNVKFLATNEKLSDEQLNKLIFRLENAIPDFPDLSKKAISYDYESGINVISLTWAKGYDVSEDHGDYVLDFNREGHIIGVELLNFKIESKTSK